jgi:hypothetical protein
VRHGSNETLREAPALELRQELPPDEWNFRRDGAAVEGMRRDVVDEETDFAPGEGHTAQPHELHDGSVVELDWLEGRTLGRRRTSEQQSEGDCSGDVLLHSAPPNGSALSCERR